jgi:hypothetical protein
VHADFNGGAEDAVCGGGDPLGALYPKRFVVPEHATRRGIERAMVDQEDRGEGVREVIGMLRAFSAGNSERRVITAHGWTHK